MLSLALLLASGAARAEDEAAPVTAGAPGAEAALDGPRAGTEPAERASATDPGPPAPSPASPSPGDSIELERVVVSGTASWLPGRAGDTSATTGVVTAGRLANLPRTRTAEILETVPGMVVTQHSGTGHANQYLLRGFNLDHGTDFSVRLDDMPVNLPSHTHGQGYADIGFVTPELFARMRYTKGPYDPTTGDFSAAGSARIQLLDRLAAPFVLVEGGQFGYRRAVAAGSFDLGPGSLLLGIEGQGQDGPWEVPENARKGSLTARYSQGAGADAFSLTLLAYHARWTASDQVPARALAEGRIGRFGSLDPTAGGDTRRASLSARLARQNPAGVARVSLYGITYGLNLYSNFTYFLVDPVNGDQILQTDRRRIFGGRIEQDFAPFTAGGVRWEPLLGVDGRFDAVHPVGVYATRARERLSTAREDRVDIGAGAVYAKTTLVPLGLPWLRLVPGARYDRQRARVASNLTGARGRVDAGLFSPSLSVVLGPWADGRSEFFVNAGRGFHSNDARGATGVSEAGAEIAPLLVRATGYDLGARGRPVDGVQVSAGLWMLDLDSELVFIGDAGTTEPSRASRRVGAELAASWALGPRVLLDADVAVTRARYRGQDPEGAFIPEALDRAASVGVVFDGVQGFSGGVRLRYLGPRPLTGDNSVRAGSSTLVSLRAGYAVTPRVSLTLEVLNLFDRQVSDTEFFYATRLAGEAEPVLDRNIRPAEPRQGRLSLRVAL